MTTETKAFEQGKIYVSSANGDVTTTLAASAASVTGCTANNVVKEVFYTVKYTTSNNGLFKIQSIVYDLVI